MTLEIRADPVPLRRDEGGQVRIAGSRIPLEAVLSRYLRGEGPEEIVEALVSLSLADVHAVIAYYWRHREEVDAYLRACESEAEATRQEMDRRSPWPAFKERLLERRAARSSSGQGAPA
jgi:uncharacterized protein (DUF433 family)